MEPTSRQHMHLGLTESSAPRFHACARESELARPRPIEATAASEHSSTFLSFVFFSLLVSVGNTNTPAPCDRQARYVGGGRKPTPARLQLQCNIIMTFFCFVSAPIQQAMSDDPAGLRTEDGARKRRPRKT